MAKITRKTQEVFALTSGEIGQFGSGQVGTKVITTDLDTVQALAAWAGGWSDAVLGANNFPLLEEMNALGYTSTSQIAYVLQEGIPEYDSGTTYFAYSIVKDPSTWGLYGSKIDTNLGNALPAQVDDGNWKYLGDLSDLGDSSYKTKLTANTTFYVATTGNDTTGDGASGTPWLTLQHAYDHLVNNYNLAGYTVTIQVADGTYSNGISAFAPIQGATNSDSVIVNGNSGTPSNVLISSTTEVFSCASNARFKLQNMKLTSSSGHLVTAYQSGTIDVGAGVDFGAATSYYHILSHFNGSVLLSGNYTISGNADYHIVCQANGVVEGVGITVTLSGTPAFANAFIFLFSCASAYLPTITYSGAATGARYNVITNSVINTNGGGATYFPGDSAGSTATGGVYV